MVTIEHGDMVEQRRGGVDVLRILVRNLSIHEQSGAVCIQPSSSGDGRLGWLLFRLGQPVMAFYQGETQQQGLEALISIEEDALDVANELRLYELTMNALRSTMTQHPDSVLHLEHQEHRDATASWWSSVRLPSSSWRRAARLEEIEALALESEHRRREAVEKTTLQLQPGRVYLLDSPDPHPMISLGVELAERGMPLLGLFGLPHAETDATHRLPRPQSYALLSPHGGYEVLHDQTSIQAVVNAFQWGNERSVLLIDGLDRLANAFGENGMVDVFRSICDGVRFNDHVALITTDLELFETAIQRSIASETTELRGSTVLRWIEDSDVLWDHPVLLAPDEEEEQWLAAQIQHQGAKVGGPAVMSDAGLEGGSVAPDDDERIEATRALNQVVESWPEEAAAISDNVPEHQANDVAIGATAWRPEVKNSVLHGRFVSESPRANVETTEVDLHRSQGPFRRQEKKPARVEAPPQLRPPQRLPARKQPPRLPNIDQGLTGNRSSAVVNSATTLPDWPFKGPTKRAYRKENMDVFSEKQRLALERQERMTYPTQAKALRDNVSGSPDLSEAHLPPPAVNKTVKLPSNAEATPLSNSLRPVDEKVKPSREIASKSQAQLDLEKAYVEWSTFDEPDGMDATALYNERGEALKRYSGEEP